MERKLLTKRGKALYALRGQTVEPVFGQMYERALNRFLLRGKEGASCEWTLFYATHNLLIETVRGTDSGMGEFS